MSKHMKTILAVIALLLVSSVTAQEKPLAETIEDCEESVRSLNHLSETIDRVGVGATDSTQQYFSKYLHDAYDCAVKLTNIPRP